ncbi:MAG: hypothetical protein MI741_13985, partial [Rhodospirillales bacterium]|nr:hypothetical protein [Rhodospirillales bacterium]
FLAFASDSRSELSPENVFTHPTRKYSVSIPDDARIREPGGNVDIAIDSDKGFGVILQSSDIGPNTSISEMAATLESAYLGPKKAWQRKVGQEISLVAGLVSFNGYYEGDGASYRVVIVRGQVNTYTFIFRARTESFAEFDAEFSWMLQHFRPGPGDLPPETPSSATTAPPPSETMSTPENNDALQGGRKFAELRLGYSLEYDVEWILERPSPEAIMLSGPEGSDAFFATVSVQNVAPPHAESPVQAASQIMDQLHDQFEKGAKEVVFSHEAPYIYQKDETFLLGRELGVTYVKDGERLRQWTIVVPRPNGKVAHIWSYRAPAAMFERFLPVAQSILSSWTIVAREDAAVEIK